MHALVIVYPNGREESIFVAEKRLDAELRRQRHIRSLSPGVAEVRELADAPKKAPAKKAPAKKAAPKKAESKKTPAKKAPAKKPAAKKAPAKKATAKKS